MGYLRSFILSETIRILHIFLSIVLHDSNLWNQNIFLFETEIFPFVFCSTALDILRRVSEHLLQCSYILKLSKLLLHWNSTKFYAILNFPMLYVYFFCKNKSWKCIVIIIINILFSWLHIFFHKSFQL